MSQQTIPTHFKKPTWKAPQKPPNWEELEWDAALEAMKHHLQTAVILELYTIPLYLYAAYSIKNNDQAMSSIIGVVVQEMLHLALAGNTLCSIGGTPRVYGDQYTPKYPREIFYEKVVMNLLPATKDTLAIFVEVEEPYPTESVMKVSEPGILPEYDSIGQFYQNITHGLTTLDSRAQAEGKTLWQKATFPKQFQTADGSWSGPEMQAITNLQVAKQSLDLIILQGEGATGEPNPSGSPSHYQIFKQLYEDPALDCYPVQENIDPSQLTKETFYELLIAADAAYCYLLLTIEALWQYDGSERGNVVGTNIFGLMFSVIKPVAQFLVQQPIKTLPNVTANAGFPYRRFDFTSPAEALTQLTAQMQKGLAAYPNEPSLNGVLSTTQGLVDLKTIPPSA